MNNILIVDDDIQLSSTIKEVLERAGYLPTVLHCGEDAIELVKKETFNIILLDLIMPGIKGIDAMIEIKKISPRSKVIMITAFATIDSAVLAIQKGASEYISKPFKINELLTVVNRVTEEIKFVDNIKHVDLDFALSSFSNSIRRDILSMLFIKPKMRFMEIVKQLGIEDSRKVVFHLKILKEANFVTQDPEKQYYLSSEGNIAYNSLKIFKDYLVSSKSKGHTPITNDDKSSEVN
jgi:CheY-like chemotaxis protein